MNDTLRVGQTGHLVLVVREVGCDAVDEVLTDAVVPGDLDLIALVLDVATIDVGSSRTIGEQRWGAHQPVLGGLLVPVEANAQTVVQETGVKAQVELFGGLPLHVLVRQDVGIGTDAGIVLAVEIVGIVEGYCGHVLERRDVTVTVLSPAGAYLQEVQPATRRLHEALVADDPASRY